MNVVNPMDSAGPLTSASLSGDCLRPSLQSAERGEHSLGTEQGQSEGHGVPAKQTGIGFDQLAVPGHLHFFSVHPFVHLNRS